MTTAGLDPDTEQLIRYVSGAAPTAGADASATRIREQFRDMIGRLRPHPPEPFAGRIVDTAIAGVPTRHYIPERPRHDGDVVVWLHGGGWVVGDLDSADPHARAIASLMAVTVVSVDYRLAPEHPYPAGFEDCLAVLRHVGERASGFVGVAGDSAGGNLAAATALAAAREGLRCDAQLLFFPGLDPAMTGASHRERACGFLLEADTVAWYWRTYRAGTADGSDPYLSPLSADERLLEVVAPAVVTTAGFDPLRDEGRRYAQRLVGAGVPTVYLPEPGLVHGYLDHVQLVPAAVRARDRAVAAFDALRGR